MKTNEIEKYCERLLDMNTGLSTETSFTRSYAVEIDTVHHRILYTPNMPSSTLLDNNFYQKIFKIWNIGLYPYLTLLKQQNAVIVEREGMDFSQARAFSFPYIDGIPKRLVIDDFNIFCSSLKNQEVPLMKNLTLDYSRISCLAIAGSTGSGKSTALVYLIKVLARFSDILVIDPKVDMPARLCKQLAIPCLVPSRTKSNADFLAQVNDQLGQAVNLIYERQEILFSNPTQVFKPYIIVVDELIALKQGTTAKPVIQAFDTLINTISLMGRGTSVCLVLSSQNFNVNESISSSCRSQISCSILLGKINSQTMQYLFPDLGNSGSEGLVIPNGVGSGIVQINDGVLPNNVLPIQMPTIRNEEV